MIMIMARATGWSEHHIKTMPLKSLLQYVHAWLVHEGKATSWLHEDYERAQNVIMRLEDIIKSDNQFLENYGY